MNKKFLISSFLTVTLIFSGAISFGIKNNNDQVIQSIKEVNKNENNIENFNIERTPGYNNKSNSVNYEINYEENNVWFWRSTMDDWNQTQNWVKDSTNPETWWYKGETPSFTIDYIGEYDENGSPLNADNPPVFYGWKSTLNNQNDIIKYTYKWSNTYQKAKIPSINDKSNWEMSNKTDVNAGWEMLHKQWYEWQPNGKLEWDPYTRTETGTGNKSIWIDWNIFSDEVEIDSGTEWISTSDIHLDQPDRSNATYTNGDPTSSKEPDIIKPENRIDSDNSGVSGSTNIFIDDLSLGWDYVFTADLMFKDSNGKTHTFDDSYIDKFSLERNAPYSCLTSSSPDVNSVTFNMETVDSQSSRTTPISWTISEIINGSEQIVDSGSISSNSYSKTIITKENSEYKFSYYYEYKTNSSSGSVKNNKGEKKQISNGESNTEKNGVTLTDYSLSNITQDRVTLNLYLDSINNYIPDDVNAGWIIDGKSYKVEEGKLHPGTNSIVIKIPDSDSDSILISSFITGEDTKLMNGLEKQKKYIINNNFETPFGIVINNSTSTNRETIINYNVIGNKEDISFIEYRINNGKWIRLPYDSNNNESEYFSLFNLNPNTYYNISMRAVGFSTIENNFGVEIFSNDFKFKTDFDSTIYINENITTSNVNSVTIGMTINNIEYIDNKEVRWTIQDDSTNKYLMEGVQKIGSDGNIWFTIDNLNPNTKYNIYTNTDIERVVKKDYISLTTEGKQSDVNNAYITNITKKKSSMIVNYSGVARTIEYSLTAEKDSWNTLSFDKNVDKQKLTFNVPENNGVIYFRLNGSNNSLYTWYDGIDTSVLILHIKNTTAIIIGTIFGILIFSIIAGALAYLFHYWLKKYGKNIKKNNMWK